jgi:arylsulfatase A-like enzyme
VDLYPTLLEVAGAQPPPNYPLDGVSYFKALTSGGKTPLNRDAIFWHFPGYLGAGAGSWRTTPAGAIRSGDWKLQEFFEDGRVELYNLRDDLGQTNNLAQKLPDKAKELQARLAAWRQEINAPMPTKNTEQGQPAKAKKGKKKQKKNAASDE